MNWSDVGLVLGVRSLGESSVILELITREHGRHLGLVRGGRSQRARPVLQTGNTVSVTWRARLDEQLGTFTVEPERSRAARLMMSPLALHGVATLASHLRLLPERDPHPLLFDAAEELAECLDDPAAAPARMARFEVTLLAELGFGLDLGSCAATGDITDLAYVSPKSGRAVGRDAGEPWRTRLLPLPGFLTDSDLDAGVTSADMAAAFRLTGHFLDGFAYGPRNRLVPDERARFVDGALRRLAGGDPARLEAATDHPTDSVEGRGA